MKASLLILLLAIPARAEFIDLGSTTLDISTGLEWMDVDQTFTVDYCCEMRGVVDEELPLPPGWRFATYSEIHTLADEWVAMLGHLPNDPAWTAWFFGPTYAEGWDDWIWTAGFYGSLGEASVALVYYRTPGPESQAWVQWFTFPQPDFHIGQWWVKESAELTTAPIAEPSAGWLFLAGLGFLMINRNKKEKS